MKIHGREVGFLRTVGATCKFAEACPDGDINKAGEIFSGNYTSSQLLAAKFIVYQNEGYEQDRKYSDAKYEPNPLTVDEVLSLTEEDFTALFQEALDTWLDEKATVETEAPKGKKKATTRSR